MEHAHNLIQVDLDRGEYPDPHVNPMAATYQYEYAMYLLVCDMFREVRCKSNAVEVLKLYFAELVKVSKELETPSYKRQDEVLDEVERLVDRDVKGIVKFPSASSCMAECHVFVDGKQHMFLFTDGEYGFMVKLHMIGRSYPDGISVKNIKM